MPYLINPAGRWVAIDDPKDFEKWSHETSFTKPTPEEEKVYIQEKTLKIEEMKRNQLMGEVKDEYKNGVYMATVSTGGKDGYGVASEKLIKELKNVGVDISVYYDSQRVGLLFHNPYSVLKMETKYRIIYTMFESDKIPDEWIPYLEVADRVVVPTKWCKEVFEKAGIACDVVNLGIDGDVWQYKERENKRKRRKDFVFLHYNAFNIRKGFLELFKAFTQEFKHDEPVKLILKTNLKTIPLPITKEKYSNIEIINESLSEKELVELTQNADCFVFPSRGEGFGMTPLEAMATGCPAIVPNAHGISEYFNPKYMYEVKVKETCPALYSRYKGKDVGNMVICDVDDLARQMRWVYEHQDEAIAIGKKASEYARRFNFRNTATQLKRIIDEVSTSNPVNKPLRNVLQLERL